MAPVMMLYMPVKINVVPRLRSLARVRDRTMGMYVPRSPMAPLSSAQVERKTRLLFTFCTAEELASEVGGGFGGAMELELESSIWEKKGNSLFIGGDSVESMFPFLNEYLTVSSLNGATNQTKFKFFIFYKLIY